MTAPQPTKEPTDPKSIMFDAFASNWWVIGLAVLAILATVVDLRFVVVQWPTATVHGLPPLDQSDTVAARSGRDSLTATSGGSSQAGGAPPAPQGGGAVSQPSAKHYPEERDVLLMIILLGALGGLVHLSSSLVKYVGNRELKRSWILYYFLMPVEGAAIAPMIYLLLRAGVLAAPTVGADGAQPTTANLNLGVLYGFAALTGLFSKQAIEKLADVFDVIFKRVKAKDATDTASGPASGAVKP